jgi:hypothetical protein
MHLQSLRILCAVALCVSSLTAAERPTWLTGTGPALFAAAPNVQGSGLNLLMHGEGGPKGTTIAGTPAWLAVKADATPGYYSLAIDPLAPDAAKVLAVAEGPALVIRYCDTGAGNVWVSYDSSDATVLNAPYPPGVWKKPASWVNGITCIGDQQVKTISALVPALVATRRCHGADIRIDATGVPGFTLIGVALVPELP